MNQILADGVVQDIESPIVAKFICIRASGNVYGVGPLLQDAPRVHLLECRYSGVGINMPVQDEASDPVGHRSQIR